MLSAWPARSPMDCVQVEEGERRARERAREGGRGREWGKECDFL